MNFSAATSCFFENVAVKEVFLGQKKIWDIPALNKSLFGLWRLNGDATDSGNLHNLSNNNGVTFNSTTAFFTASDQSLSSYLNFDTTKEFTISIALKPDFLKNNSTILWTNFGDKIFADQSGRLFSDLIYNTQFPQTAVSLQNFFSNNTDVTLTLVRSGNGKICVYRNESVIDVLNASNGATGSRLFMFGNDPFSNNFSGAFRHIAIWQRALSKNEVQQIFINGVDNLEPAWTPAQSTTELWLDAANSASLVMSGNNVSQWSDLSGNNRHGTQSVVACMPAVTADGISFDGVDDCFFFPAGFLNASNDFTIAMVMSAPLQQNDAIFGPSTTNSTGLELICTATASLPTLLRINGANKITDGLWSTDSTRALTTIVASSSSCNGYKDGALVSNASGISPLNFNGIYAIGSYSGNSFGGGNLSAQMQMCEFLIFPSTSESDRQKIEGYLAHKWGVTSNLPVSHPYKTQAP